MKNILVAIDFSDETECVIDAARELASAFCAKLWLVHVAAPDPDLVGYRAGPQTVRDTVARELRREHQQLQQLAGDLRASDIDTTALHVQGPTVQTLVAEARHLDADHIVIGCRGLSGLKHLLLGSIAERVVQRSPCPVLTVKTPD